jgi:hypothetical protein
MSPQSRRAEWLIHQTKAETSDYGRITQLERIVRDLCAELQTLHGDNATPQTGSELLRLPLGDGEALVEFDYRAGRPGKLYGPPEDCYEDEPEEIDILGALVNGTWVDADCFSQEVLDRWEEQISEQAAENRAESFDEPEREAA